MDKKLLDILKKSEEPISDDDLIGYLQDSLPSGDLQNIQQKEIEDAMMADAIEGLQSIKDKARLEAMAKEMNQQLQKKLKEKKQKHIETRKWKDQNWINLTIVSVLLLIILCFLVFKYLK